MKTKKNNKQMRCPYCGATVMLRDASFVYGKMLWKRRSMFAQTIHLVILM